MACGHVRVAKPKKIPAETLQKKEENKTARQERFVLQMAYTIHVLGLWDWYKKWYDQYNS